MKYYVFCDNDCKYEGMTKEQIIAAIAEATGNTPTDIDSAFISKIKESNNNSSLSFWFGTESEFNALGVSAEKYRLSVSANGKVYIVPDNRDDSAVNVANEAKEIANNAKTKANAALARTGGTMSGAINMGSNKITNVSTPTNNADAANKSYVDGKRIYGDCTLSASGWKSDGTQTITSSRVYGDDMPHWGVVYSTNNREAEKEAFALVDELETQDGAFVFRCFGDVPTVNLNIQWEVHR